MKIAPTVQHCFLHFCSFIKFSKKRFLGAPETPSDILLGGRLYSYQMETAIKLGGIVFSIYHLGKIVQQRDLCYVYCIVISQVKFKFIYLAVYDMVSVIPKFGKFLNYTRFLDSFVIS